MCIIDKVKGDAKKGLFFARKSLDNNWGRAVLLNFLSTDLYERQGAAQTNFAITIPAPESDLAQELLKSPYDFTFLPGNPAGEASSLRSSAPRTSPSSNPPPAARPSLTFTSGRLSGICLFNPE